MLYTEQKSPLLWIPLMVSSHGLTSSILLFPWAEVLHEFLKCLIPCFFFLSTFLNYLPNQNSKKKKVHNILGKFVLLLFSHPVVSNSLWPHGLQNVRPSCPSPSPEVFPSSCPLHWWCHPAISSSGALFSFCPQTFPASGTLFATYDQNTGASASPSVLPVTIPGWSPLRLTGLILLSKGLLGVFSSSTVQRHQFFGALPSLWSSSHNRTWPLGRP